MSRLDSTQHGFALFQIRVIRDIVFSTLNLMSFLVYVGQSVAVVNISYDKDVLKDFAHLICIRMLTAIRFSGATYLTDPYSC